MIDRARAPAGPRGAASHSPLTPHHTRPAPPRMIGEPRRDTCKAVVTRTKLLTNRVRRREIRIGECRFFLLASGYELRPLVTVTHRTGSIRDRVQTDPPLERRLQGRKKIDFSRSKMTILLTILRLTCYEQEIDGDNRHAPHTDDPGYCKTA